MNKRLKRTIIGLCILSACIYIAQLWIFHDPQTTFFYILQDMAFLPLSIAIATIIVGEVMSAREKKERIQKTKMLTSSFYSEMGAALMLQLYRVSVCDSKISDIVAGRWAQSVEAVSALQDMLRSASIHVQITEEAYTEIRTLILEKQTQLLIIASNPVLLDHEDFTNMLWGIFHLVDEFRLRGEYVQLSQADRAHFNSDFADVLRMLLVNWVSNITYMQETYPNFFTQAKSRLEEQN